MQINKLHIQSQNVATPKGPKSVASGIGSKGSETTGSRDGLLSPGIEALWPFTNRLQEIPEVRTEVVDAARARLANGEYLTPEAAVETAAAILKRS